MFLPHHFPGQDWLGILIVAPEPWVTQLTELYLGLGDLQGSRMPAHVTTLPPTPLLTGERLEVIRHLREVTRRHSPFRVTLEDSDSFRPLSQVAFLSLSEGAVERVSLADGVRTGSFDTGRCFPYHPHVTLARGVGNPTLNLTLDPGANFEVSQLVPGFRLDRIDENDVYSTMVLFDFEASLT